MMSDLLDRRVLEQLIARLCHDLVGPIAAIGNGAELLADEDPSFAGEAVRLVAQSAGEAVDRLHFYRFAYGFSGADAAPRAPPQLAARLFASTTISCDYTAAARLLPLRWQQLVCNLLLVGADGLPHGGRLAVAAGARGLFVEAVGTAAVLLPEPLAALSLTVPVAALTPRSVPAYFAGLLARGLGRRVLADNAEAGRFRIDVPAAAAPLSIASSVGSRG
jgi:histidine phosphotransferase ChpT